MNSLPGLYRGPTDTGVHLRRLHADKVVAHGGAGAQGADTKKCDRDAAGARLLRTVIKEYN